MNYWITIEKTLKFSQTAALLEIAHSLFGLVRSPVMTTFLQGTFNSSFYKNSFFPHHASLGICQSLLKCTTVMEC